MTTVHHPAPIHNRRSHAEFGEHHEWLWIGLSIILVAALAAGFAWLVVRPFEPAPTAASRVSGFDYNNAATSGQMISPGVTSQYFGNSGELIGDAAVSEYDHEMTTGHIVSPGVTTPYFGNSGVLFPEAPTSEYDHETSRAQTIRPGVTTPYFGESGELDPEK
ncbi:MAG: hypothetical protein GWP18_06860 [Proteobacteria bacterium]|nr:hypothetical protein [Pseudomonadota bacterium]